ncbi:MAG: DUF262 domain-containing protein [Chloroflexota bacterium]|nr:DUF262 domain-containing protein [Chloroflexota bacterium]MDE3268537.1 DUF262 domain-containing protein [Chloroflexota bacterium]
MKISTVLDQIDLGAMALPVFQRGFVWNRSQVRGLMQSLYRRHPVGTLLTWKTQTENVAVRGSGQLQAGYVSLLLDGQQRITSLYGIVRGKNPPFFEGDSSVFRGLYFNVLTETFSFYAPIAMQNDPAWISVTELMREDIKPFVDRIKDDPVLAPELASIVGRLTSITGIRDMELHTEELSGEYLDEDIVVEIFNRVNSSGTNLSKGDLALAKLCAKWPEARKQMNMRLSKWKNAGFSFKLDWLLRCVTTLITGEAQFTALANVKVVQFREGLIKTEKHVDYLLNLIASRLGLDHGRVLGSPGSFPLMVRYLEQRGGKLADQMESDRLLYWYIHTLLWGRYSSSTESVLGQDLAAIKDADDDLGRLIEGLRRDRGDLKLTASDFQGWRVDTRFYPMLYMLTRVQHSRDWCSGIELSHLTLGRSSSLQLHHIFPKSRLYDNGYSLREVNALANFTFLTQSCNLEVSNRYPSEYLPKYRDSQSGAVESHWIPMDEDLWQIGRYRDFLAKRRELLAAAANGFLDALREGSVPPSDAISTSLEDSEEVSPTMASLDEDEILLDANIWVTEQGLPEGEMPFELVDEATGELLAILDLAWPHGLQEGLSKPVALLIDEDAEVEAVASQHGFSCYTDAESLKGYVATQILASEEPAVV